MSPLLLTGILHVVFQIFFETAKGHVEEAYGVQSTKSECSVAPENFEPFDMPKTIRHLHSHFNDLTTRGLYHLTMIVTGGSIKDMKTRQSMQKVVKEYLPKVLRKHRNSSCICEMCKQLHQLLSNPRNFQGSNPMFLAPATRSEKAAVIKLLDRLDGFPYRVLVAISRELKGKPVKAPSKCGRSRDDLVRQVRTTSMNMLSELDEGEALQEPLAKAMTIAVLSLKLTSGPQNFYLTGFREISPQVKALQDDVVKAIWLLRTKEFQSCELDKLRVFFYPENKISRDYIKPSVKKMLTDYLFDSCDVEAIPKSILEGLAFINRKSRTVQNAVFSKDELKEEVECIMDLSAQTKQLAWDLLPANEYHKGFTDAYLEELQESDDDDFSDEDGIEKPLQSWKADGSEAELVEGFGESVAVGFGQMPFDRKESSFSPLVMAGNVVTPKLEPDLRTRFESASPCYTGVSFLFEDSKHSEGRACMEIDRLGHTSDLFSPVVLASDTFMTSHVRFSANSFERHKIETDALGDQKQYASRQCPWQNQYLAIQDVCDETSMVAYNLVGFMLEELVRAEGLELDARERFYLKGEYSCEEEDHSGKL